jgi:hypothetical protein
MQGPEFNLSSERQRKSEREEKSREGGGERERERESEREKEFQNVCKHKSKWLHFTFLSIVSLSITGQSWPVGCSCIHSCPSEMKANYGYLGLRISLKDHFVH